MSMFSMGTLAAFAGANLAMVAFAPQSRAASEEVVYSFTGGLDGANPYGALTVVGNLLYGTASAGGTTQCSFSTGCGTIFTVSTSGVEKTIYAFNNFGDGENPVAGLLYVSGKLFGTTVGGGIAENGTVFSITPAGVETVLYNFKETGDGDNPWGGLINVGGTLYGMTTGISFGSGLVNDGAVYSVTTSGVETVLYTFGGGTDGSYPYGGLIKVGENFYGTTSSGGTNGYGTIFSVSPSGSKTVIHFFQGGTDGQYPASSLTNVGGTLYGTTADGGGAPGCIVGCGTIFSVTPSGVEKVIYAFKGGTDGAYPKGTLLKIGGTLFGTTQAGGGSSNCSSGCGAVFKLRKGGSMKLMYSFKGGADGSDPYAGLIRFGGSYYGTTVYGGGSSCFGGRGCGTVFRVTP